jgi:hypothetical protein
MSYNDPETLRLLLEQRREELRRTMAEGRPLAAWLTGAARRSVEVIETSRRASRVRASRRPA